MACLATGLLIVCSKNPLNWCCSAAVTLTNAKTKVPRVEATSSSANHNGKKENCHPKHLCEANIFGLA